MAVSIRENSVSSLISRNNATHLLSPINEKEHDEIVDRESLMDNSYDYIPDPMKHDFGGGDIRDTFPTVRQGDQSQRLDDENEERKEGDG